MQSATHTSTAVLPTHSTRNVKTPENDHTVLPPALARRRSATQDRIEPSYPSPNMPENTIGTAQSHWIGFSWRDSSLTYPVNLPCQSSIFTSPQQERADTPLPGRQ